MRKRKEKVNGNAKPRKPWYKRWYVWYAAVTIIGFIAIKDPEETKPVIVEDTTTAEETTEEETTTEEITELYDPWDELPDKVRDITVSLTMPFVVRVVGEEYDFNATYTVEYDTDENGNYIIEVLYIPTDAGNGKTKVNLTIVKDSDGYVIEKAMLAGMYEVDMDTVQDVFKKYYE